MKENKKYFIIIIILLILIIILLSLNFLKKDNQNVQEKENVIEKSNSSKNNIIEDSDLSINEQEIKTDSDLEEYVEDVEKEVDTITNKEKLTSTDKSTLKNTFKTLTDFIFYDGTIKGKTFSSLTEETKVKIIDTYNRIDEKIERKFPNYKETIKSTASKTYTNIKEKATSLKEKIVSSYSNYVGEDGLSETVEAYEEDKENFDTVVEPYKEKSKGVIDKTIETIKSIIGKEDN